MDKPRQKYQLFVYMKSGRDFSFKISTDQMRIFKARKKGEDLRLVTLDSGDIYMQVEDIYLFRIQRIQEDAVINLKTNGNGAEGPVHINIAGKVEEVRTGLVPKDVSEDKERVKVKSGYDDSEDEERVVIGDNDDLL